MARKRPELVWLHRLNGTQLAPLHDLRDLVVEDRLGDLEALTVTIRADDPKAALVVPDTLTLYGGRYYRIAELRQLRDGPQILVEIYCEARWMDLGKRVRSGVFPVLGKTPEQGLTQILAGTGWTVGDVPANPDLFSIEDIDPTALSLVRRWATVTGYEIEFDTVARTVSLVPSVGEDRGIGFRYGLNLRQVDRRYEPPRATRLYAFGANDLDISAVNPSGLTYIEDYSWYTDQGLTLAQAQATYRKDETWIDARYLLPVNLYDAAVLRLAARAQPIISYELAVSDLAELTSSPADDVRIGDTVRVRDAGFGIDLETRVVRLIRRPLDPQQNEVELDYLQPGLIEAERSDSTRSINYGELAILVDQNAELVTVTSSVLTWGAIAITIAGSSTVILGGTFIGTATGSGTVTFGAYVDGTPIGAEYLFDFDAAVETQVEFSWPTMTTGLGDGSYNIEWRARVSTGAGTIECAAETLRSWLLARGAVGVGVNLNPSQTISEVVDALDPLLYIAPTGDDWTVAVTDIAVDPGDPDLLVDVDEGTVAEVDPLLYIAPTEDEFSADPTPLVQWIANTTETFGAGDSITTISATCPTVEADDLIVAFLMQQAGSSDVTAPAGFTRISQQQNTGSSTDQWSEIWVADAAGTEGGTSLTFTTTVAGRLGLMLAVLRDTDAVGVVADTNSNTNYNASGGLEPFASVSSAGIGYLAVAFDTCSEIDTGSTTFSEPSGWTRVSRATATDSPTHEGNRMFVAYRRSAVETIASFTTTHSGGTHDAASILTVFRPA